MPLQPHRRKREPHPRLGEARASALPRLLRPPLATLVDHVPEGADWLHEIKHDGYRVLCRLEHGNARLYSRNGNELTPRMRAIARAVEALAELGDAWLDGEVVVPQADGRSSFASLQAALSDGRDHDMLYYLFDLPYANGRNYTQEPLRDRKARLARLLREQRNPDTPLRYTDHLQGDGQRFYDEACRFQLEGVVSKNARSSYRGGRGHDWVKTKCRLRQEFLVCGYTAPRGSRAGLGALALGLYDAAGQLHYCGRTGTGFNAAALRSMREHLDRLVIDTPPFAEPIPRDARKDVTWVKPETVVEVAFTGWTRDGFVRQASFQGVREDKAPRDVVREVAETVPADPDAALNAPSTRHPRQAPALTHPDKVLYPDQGLTKADLANYYGAIVDWILPYVAHRPLTLVRCPDGRHKQCFFQKHASGTTPTGLLRVPLTEDGGAKRATYLALSGPEGLLALVQMGVLEIHVWNARIDRPEIPDQLVIDLDPDAELGWDAAREAALLTRARLHDLGLPAFLRTTGGKGLHVVVPLARRHTWHDVKRFAKAFAEDLVRGDPARYVARASLAARHGKVFVDYLRNARGATAIASYSTRARQGAPVAVPLAWEELTPTLRPDQHNVLTVPARLQTLSRDPWEEFERARHALTQRMKRALGITD